MPSKAETAIMNRQIAAIRNPQERAAVESQSLVWKMTTFLCQKAARAPLTHLGAGSRFFLQDDRPDSQVLVSSSLLKGRGQFRQADGINWTSFSWSCHLDPETGAVKRFEATPVADTDAAVPSMRSARETPACQAAIVEIRLDDQNGAFDGMSQSGTMLVVRNTGSESCLMPPVPSVQFEDEAGHKLPVIRRPAVQVRRPGPHGAKSGSMLKPLCCQQGERYATLHWVSGDVYDDSHHCVRPTRLVLTVGQGEKQAAFKGQLCAPAKASLMFDQSPLQAHTEAH